MIFKIAWRNIWRSKLRSFTVMGSVIIGVWSLSFMLAFFAGFIEAYVRSAIENDLSHIQLHHPDFKKDKEVQYRLQDIEAIEKQLTSLDAVKAYTVRSLNNGMLATAKGSRGIQIRGVLSEKEAAITNLDQKITAGVYFDATKKKKPYSCK
jgi:ABC-type lipoprotein release transport system permease subunit